jgi:hypothetical protein
MFFELIFADPKNFISTTIPRIIRKPIIINMPRIPRNIGESRGESG